VTRTNPRDLLDWCAAERRWLLDMVSTLAALESPSTDRDAVNRCGTEIAARLHDLGGIVTRLPGGVRADHVRADFGTGRRRVLLLGHFDTVWPIGQIGRMPVREEDGRLHGPGVFDMKAGIAIAMLSMRAISAFQSERYAAVTMLWTTDEEIGSESSRGAIERIAGECDAVLVLEPSLPGGAAKTSRKGVGEFEVTVHGVSAHAGIDPTKGASAILELARQIIAVQSLQDLDRGLSINVGRIEGGSRTNVVAELARATIDVRVQTMADAAAIERTLRALEPANRATRLEISGGVNRPPLERTPAVVALFELAREAAHELGQELKEGATGGGSDGNFTAAVGVPTLDGLGPRGDGAHAQHEHVEIDDLPWRAALLTTMLSRLGD
jgi:glutamate carboxypeptidase